MPCLFCDAPLPSGARYCPTCGTALQGSSGRRDELGPKGSLHRRPSEPPVYPAWGPVATCDTAIVSLCSGIATWTIFPVLGAIIAVITGHAARRQIRDSYGHLEGDGLAVTGMLLGYAQIGLILVVLALGFLLIAVRVAVH